MTHVLLNGTLLPAERAMVPALDRGLTQGLGLYETVKLTGHTPVFFEEHMDRLDKGLSALGLGLPETHVQMAADMVRLSRAARVPDGACRVLVTGGPPRGRPTVLLQVEVRRFPDHPLRLISHHSLRSAADLKSKTFTTSYLAQQAAVAAGADDALFVDQEGRAHEATTANLFLYTQRHLVTPPLDGSILPGVIRGKVMRLAAADGIPVVEDHVLVRELTALDTLLLTSSVRGIVVAASIDDRQLNVEGDIRERLRGLLAGAEAESIERFRAAYGL